MRRALYSLLFLCSACSNYSLEELRHATPNGTPFQASLALGYRQIAEDESKNQQWESASRFADKGLVAAYGQDPEPEALDARRLSDEDRAALEEARGKLTTALTAEAKQSQPEQAARAQIGFDAWLEYAERGKEPDETKHWQEVFEAALKELTQPLATADMLAEAAPALVPDPQKNAYLVFFALDRAQLDDNGRLLVDMLAEELKKQPLENISISVNGHTDTTGTPRHNLDLSQRRAKAVLEALVERGIPQAIIRAFGFGESDLRVPTKDNVSQPQNRRVEIFVGG